MRSKLKVARELLEELLAEREEMEKTHEADTNDIQARIEDQKAEMGALRDEIRSRSNRWWSAQGCAGNVRHTYASHPRFAAPLLNTLRCRGARVRQTTLKPHCGYRRWRAWPPSKRSYPLLPGRERQMSRD